MVNISALNYRVLSEAINKIQPPKTFFRDMFFGNRIPRESQYIDIDVIVGDKKLAPFVAPYEGGTVIKKLGKQLSSIKAPKIRPKKELPAAWFSEREAGTTVYLNPGDREQAQLTKINRELSDLKDKIVRREEWMCAKALTGAITVSQDNVAFSIDFGLPVAHKPVLTSTALWSDKTNSDPLSNLDDYIALVSDDSGYNVTDIVFGRNAAKAFKAHPKVLEAYDKEHIVVGEIKLKGSNYLGNYDGVDLWVNGEKYTDDAGATQYMLDPNALVVVAKNNDFELNYGAVEDLDAGGDVAVEYFSKMWKENDPSAMWILAEARPLPIPKRIESIVYAKVL